MTLGELLVMYNITKKEAENVLDVLQAGMVAINDDYKECVKSDDANLVEASLRE